MQLQFLTFLTLALDEQVSFVSWPLYPLRSDSSSHWRWHDIGSRISLDMVKTIISISTRNHTLNLWSSRV